MKRQSFFILSALVILIVSSCNFPLSRRDEDFVFPTPKTRFPAANTTQDPSNPAATPIPTFPPQRPTRDWPAPYFGQPGPTPVTPVPTPMPVLSAANSITFLLIGSDRKVSSYRTDTLIIANYQPQANIVTLISIPRDLYVYIPGWTMQRINAAYYHGESANYPGGGPEQLKDTILYNLGIYIDHVAMVDFQGFINIVDTLGGIEVPITCAYTDWMIIDPNKDPEDEDNWELTTIGPGLVSMDGDLALWYARSRLKSDDFDRGRRQQEVIRAIYQQAVNLNVLTQLPELYAEFGNTVITDLSLTDIISLAPNFARMSGARIRSYYINRDVVNGWRSPTGAALQLPDQPLLTYMLQEALAPTDYQEEVHMQQLVEVWNGTSHSNWDALAVQRLSYGGFGAVTAPADHRNHTNTILYVLGESVDPIETAALLKLLGLPQDRLMHEPDPIARGDYRLVLGEDYNPCFRPGDIDR